MSKQKLRAYKTQLDNLISNLRGEVGEIISTWTMLRRLMGSANALRLKNENIEKRLNEDLRNEDLKFLDCLADKLSDEIVARLSELSEAKIGQLTFHFAAVKLGAFESEAQDFRRFIEKRGFLEKRNMDISHKELPEEWSDHKHRSIKYRLIVEGVSRAMIIMKKIDRKVIGPSAPYLWREVRQKRYSVMNPPKVSYMLLPFMALSKETRAKVIRAEMAEGRNVWSDMTTVVNGVPTRLSVCQQWGAVLLPSGTLLLDQYPLQELTNIEVSSADIEHIKHQLPDAEPLTEERTITAKYRVTRKEGDCISFTPVHRVYQLDGGTLTELVDLDINLDDRLKQDFGEMNVGDEKEFSLTVNILIGYQQHPDRVSPSRTG